MELWFIKENGSMILSMVEDGYLMLKTMVNKTMILITRIFHYYKINGKYMKENLIMVCGTE